jgi:23S rRNA U2552 (ribose-2'-O)-methylase RlmE/FtsJ
MVISKTNVNKPDGNKSNANKPDKNIFTTYRPTIYKLPKNKSSIIDIAPDVTFSNNICYARFNLGFNHYIHKNKEEKMETVGKMFKDRKKIYLVTLPFEKNLDKKMNDTDISIDTGVTTFIKDTIKSGMPHILNRSYLKLWELIIYFDLIEDSAQFSSAHLAEGPGSFVQATIVYRDLQEKLKKIKTSKNDKYYVLSMYSDNEHLQMQKEFTNYYAKESPKRLHVLETINTTLLNIYDQEGGTKGTGVKGTKGESGAKDTIEAVSAVGGGCNGDITKISTIKIFGGSGKTKGFAESVDLVTADGGFEWKYETLQEQEAYRLIFGQIVTALKIQNNNGHFVLKVFESYTPITLKFIEILNSLYKDVYICKPFTSRTSNSEKYVVCKYFIKKNLTSKFMTQLETLVERMEKDSIYNIIDIFTNYTIPSDIYNNYRIINDNLMEIQYFAINNIDKFANLENYNGKEYYQYLEKQVESSKYWIDIFLNPDNYKNIHKYVND